MLNILKDKKVIFFDIGYTMDYPRTGDWMFMNRFMELAGEKIRKLNPETVRSAKAEGYRFLSANHLTLTIAEESEKFLRYYRTINEKLELGLTEEQIHEISDDRLYNITENYIPYPDVKKVLETLSQTHTLGIISDTWPSVVPQLDQLGLRPYFSFVTYSYELGVYKPDPRMFRDALRKAGCPAEKTVFIDDLPMNLEGAAALGITPVLIAANPVSDVEVPFTKIHALEELIL